MWRSFWSSLQSREGLATLAAIPGTAGAQRHPAATSIALCVTSNTAQGFCRDRQMPWPASGKLLTCSAAEEENALDHLRLWWIVAPQSLRPAISPPRVPPWHKPGRGGQSPWDSGLAGLSFPLPRSCPDSRPPSIASMP